MIIYCKNKKVFVTLGISLISLFAIFVLYLVIQDRYKSIVPLEQLQNVYLKKVDNDYILSGKVQLSDWETLHIVDIQPKEGNVYIYFMKSFGFDSFNTIDKKLNYSIDKALSGISSLADMPDAKCYLIEGEGIIQRHEDPRKSYTDVLNYSHKRELVIIP